MTRPKSHNGVCVYDEGWTYCKKCSEFIHKTSKELRVAKNKSLIHDDCGKQVTMRPTATATRHKCAEARGVKYID